MNQPPQLEKICQAMSAPQFYPHEVARIERRETHISVVFLTGTWVYKLKKPKNLEFLDFRKLSDRKRYCEQEVVLNQRLSDGIYQEVVGIYEGSDSNLSFTPGGEIIEYAVKMAQLPDDRNFAALLKDNWISKESIASLGQMLAAFYNKAEGNTHIDTFGDSELIRYNMEENFRQIQPYAEKYLNSEKWEFICQVCRSFLNDHTDLFLHRIKQGKIRDGHGDLRCDHIYFHNGIQIIDCIEFNERFRYGDVALDLAFLLMDLDHLGVPDIGRHLLSVYAETSKDPEIYSLLDFYAAYRALVRLKVTCFSLEQTENENHDPLIGEIKRYLNQAYQYAILFGRPTLWVFFGLPASGKSTLAEKTAKALAMPSFQSDIVRKQNQDQSDETVVPFNTGMYQPVMRNRVYAKLINLAQKELKKGKSVALDATFSDAKWHQAAAELARDMDVNLISVQCACKAETIRSRLKQREDAPGQSDARLIHFEEILKHHEPFIEKVPNSHFIIDTDHPADKALYRVLSGAYALKYEQVKSLLASLNDSST